jgi:hypothetical protein
LAKKDLACVDDVDMDCNKLHQSKFEPFSKEGGGGGGEWPSQFWEEPLPCSGNLIIERNHSHAGLK